MENCTGIHQLLSFPAHTIFKSMKLLIGVNKQTEESTFILIVNK